ncbi:MAG: class I SAM-dependent methyltransferase [Kiritimatiellia bacterium]|jgi:2-polyprenyl-3-methyl-5-hydroxy-6-metoxy-1,4-benzoquinol methylase
MREEIDIHRQGSYWNALSRRYQSFTKIRCDDFHYGPQIPGESGLRLLPAFEPGMTALELGCGGAQNSVWLAKQGVVCTAMDIAEGQLVHAERLCKAHEVNIRLVKAGFEDFDQHLAPDERFDFVHSSHALEFVQDPAAAVAAMAARLKPGGTLMISTVHPLFNGEWTTFEINDGGFRRPQTVDGLFLRSYFEPPDDIRDEDGQHVVSRAHPVSSWFRWLTDAGLQVTALEEPAAVADAPYSSRDWANHGGQLDAMPSTVIFTAKRM